METYAEAAKFGASPTRRVLVPAISAGRQPQRGIGTLWVQTMQAVRCLRSSRTTPSTPTSGACACWGRDVLERVRMRGNGAKIALQTSSWRDTYLDCAAGTYRPRPYLQPVQKQSTAATVISTAAEWALRTLSEPQRSAARRMPSLCKQGVSGSRASGSETRACL